MSTEKTLLPRPSARQWAVLCAIVTIVVPALVGGAWHIAQKAANSQLRDAIETGVKPVLDELHQEQKIRESSDSDIKKQYVELQRYERETAVSDAFRKELANKVDGLGTRVDSKYDSILGLLREQDRKITELLLQVQANKK